MISDENGRWLCTKEAFKAIFYLFAGKLRLEGQHVKPEKQTETAKRF